MDKTTTVAFLVLISGALSANTLTKEINTIESQWATIYYSKKATEQSKEYPALLTKIEALSQRHPKITELKIWQAILIATNAAFQNPFSALESINKAKAILETAILNKPQALDGAAFVTLGTLYYMTPSWPISFGNEEKAEQLLKRAIKLNPNSIDSNYFFADYLLTKDKVNEATQYLKKALSIPSRPEQTYADDQLKIEAQLALVKTEQRKLNSGKYKFLSLFYTAKSSNTAHHQKTIK